MAFEVDGRDLSGQILKSIARFISAVGVKLKTTGLVQPVMVMNEHIWSEPKTFARVNYDFWTAAGVITTVPEGEEWRIYYIYHEAFVAVLRISWTFGGYWYYTEAQTAVTFGTWRFDDREFILPAGTTISVFGVNVGDNSRDLWIGYRSRPFI